MEIIVHKAGIRQQTIKFHVNVNVQTSQKVEAIFQFYGPVAKETWTWCSGVLDY